MAVKTQDARRTNKKDIWWDVIRCANFSYLCFKEQVPCGFFQSKEKAVKLLFLSLFKIFRVFILVDIFNV